MALSCCPWGLAGLDEAVVDPSVASVFIPFLASEEAEDEEEEEEEEEEVWEVAWLSGTLATSVALACVAAVLSRSPSSSWRPVWRAWARDAAFFFLFAIWTTRSGCSGVGKSLKSYGVGGTRFRHQLVPKTKAFVDWLSSMGTSDLCCRSSNVTCRRCPSSDPPSQ